MNKFIYSLVFSFISLILLSCSKESVSDTTKRDRERERDRNESIFNEVKLADGSYKGSTFKSDYLLKIQAAWSSPNGGGSTATPTIVGTLSFFPQIAIQGQDPLVVNYPIIDGNYIEATKNLTLTVSTGDSTTSKMYCKMDPSKKMKCSWIPSRGEMKMEFSAINEGQENQMARPLGRYIGTTDFFNDDSTVVADFRTTLVVGNNGSTDRLAQSLVTANFSFIRPSKKVYMFTSAGNSTYDPFTQSLTFNMSGAISNNSMVVNCSIVDASNLKCHWISTRTFDFDLKLQNTDLNNPDLVEQDTQNNALGY